MIHEPHRIADSLVVQNFNYQALSGLKLLHIFALLDL